MTAIAAVPLAVRGLTHTYGAANAVEDVSFEVPAGAVAALLGPSGCGKSTILRAIAGLIQPKQGRIMLGDTDITRVPGRARGIGMVFQNYALFPHLTVAENIAYPLACRAVPRAARRSRVGDLLGMVRLDGFGRRLPRELSGGQQQRVAVARALAANPPLLLLDEPFGALDRALRMDLQIELLRLQRSLGITTLIVTHDQEEAQSLASVLVLMNRGRIEQIGAPPAVYDQPRTLFANGFLGQTSCLPGTMVTSGPEASTIRLSSGESLVLPRRVNMMAGADVVVTARPEEIRVLDPGAGPAPGRLQARRLVSLPLGPTLMHDLVLSDGTRLRAAQTRTADTGGGDLPETVMVQLDLERCHVFPPDAGNGASANIGAPT